MNRLDDPEARVLNRDALINIIYRIQAGLNIMAEQLARDRNPDCSDITLWSIQERFITRCRCAPQA